MLRFVTWILISSLSSMSMIITHSTYAHRPTGEPVHQKIAIIGGGMAGISAATFLKNSPHQVHLFEKEKVLGGNAQTLHIENGNGDKVAVDIGPQYFAKGPWDLYVEFLKLFELYDPADTIPFSPGFTISKEGSPPLFVTPAFSSEKIYFNLFQLKQWRSLYSFYKLSTEAHKLYQSETRDGYYITVDQWLRQLNLNKEDTENILLPFLASLIGVNIEKARQLSTLVLARLFAFKGPLAQRKYYVLTEGMGSIIQKIGKKLEEESNNVFIHCSSPIQNLFKKDDHYVIEYMNNEGELHQFIADKIIMAVHPDIAATFLDNLYEHPDPLINHLSNLSYFNAKLILHNSSRFSPGALSSFMNLQVDAHGEVTTTMELGQIDYQHYGNISKTWIHDEKTYSQLVASHSILGETVFQHPYVTPEFVTHLDEIKNLLQKNRRYHNIEIAGGWMEAGETQATSILSAYLSVCRLFPDLAKNNKWEDLLPSLSRYWY